MTTSRREANPGEPPAGDSAAAGADDNVQRGVDGHVPVSFSGARLARALVHLGGPPGVPSTPASPSEQVVGRPAMSEHALTELVLVCQSAFPQTVAASIIIGSPAAPTLIATGSKIAQALDGAQVVAGQGPTHDCWEHGRIVHTANLPEDGRWPRLADQLGDLPVCSVMSVPVAREGRRGGVLNVYSVYDDVVDAAAIETTELLGEAVAGALHGAHIVRELETVAGQLETALQSRAVIDQAKGILMARHRCDAEEAFRLLAEASSSANVKLRVLAERLVREVGQGTDEDRRID